MDAKNNGEQCAKLRIIELIENMVCTVDCKPPGNLKNKRGTLTKKIMLNLHGQ